MKDVYVCPDCGEMFPVDMNTTVDVCPFCFSPDIEFDERVDDDDEAFLLRMQANHIDVTTDEDEDEVVYEWEDDDEEKED
jgi:hypothetical protein